VDGVRRERITPSSSVAMSGSGSASSPSSPSGPGASPVPFNFASCLSAIDLTSSAMARTLSRILAANFRRSGESLVSMSCSFWSQASSSAWVFA
jgi:hypothetical protein